MNKYQIQCCNWLLLIGEWRCILKSHMFYFFFKIIYRGWAQFLRVSLPKTGPLRFGSENQFPLNFAHEYILVQK